MQKFFLSVAQYDKILDKKMPEIVEDALKAFEIGATDPGNKATFIESVKEGIINWEEHGIRNLFNHETETIAEYNKSQKDYEQKRKQDRFIISAEQKKRVLELAGNFSGLWNSETTEAQDRKCIVRLLLSDVTLAKAKVLKLKYAIKAVRPKYMNCRHLKMPGKKKNIVRKL